MHMYPRPDRISVESIQEKADRLAVFLIQNAKYIQAKSFSPETTVVEYAQGAITFDEAHKQLDLLLENATYFVEINSRTESEGNSQPLDTRDKYPLPNLDDSFSRLGLNTPSYSGSIDSKSAFGNTQSAKK